MDWMEDAAEIVQQFGFPIIAMLGLGYFVYFVWTTITEKIDPATEDMKMTVLKLIDQIRMMDNDMIRLQEKLDTVLQMKENEKKLSDANDSLNRESSSRRNKI